VNSSDVNEALARSRKGRGFVISAKSRPGCRIRRAVSREFILSDGEPITVRSVLERCYPRLRKFRSWHYDAARQALRKVATVIARNRHGRGRPALWAKL
jgi:hypothetical protein